jgi:hypothetical protein
MFIFVFTGFGVLELFGNETVGMLLSHLRAVGNIWILGVLMGSLTAL